MISHQDFVSVILCLCQGHLGVTGHVSVMSGSCQSQVSNKSGLCLGQVYQSEILLSISHMQNFSPLCIFSTKYFVMFCTALETERFFSLVIGYNLLVRKMKKVLSNNFVSNPKESTTFSMSIGPDFGGLCWIYH